MISFDWKLGGEQSHNHISKRELAVYTKSSVMAFSCRIKLRYFYGWTPNIPAAWRLLKTFIEASTLLSRACLSAQHHVNSSFAWILEENRCLLYILFHESSPLVLVSRWLPPKRRLRQMQRNQKFSLRVLLPGLLVKLAVRKFDMPADFYSWVYDEICASSSIEFPGHLELVFSFEFTYLWFFSPSTPNRIPTLSPP